MEKGRFKQVVLETDRLLLKELNKDIISNLFRYYEDDEIKYFLGLSSDNELEIERKNYEEGLATYRISFKHFLLVEKRTKRIIGKSGFHIWYLHHFRAEIGYKMYDEAHMGKGYMKEANNAIVEYGFNEMDLHRIEAFTAVDGIASQKILKGLGFKEEGLLREHYFINNRFEDSVCFGLLKKDYLNRPETK